MRERAVAQHLRIKDCADTTNLRLLDVFIAKPNPTAAPHSQLAVSMNPLARLPAGLPALSRLRVLEMYYVRLPCADEATAGRLQQLIPGLFVFSNVAPAAPGAGVRAPAELQMMGPGDGGDDGSLAVVGGNDQPAAGRAGGAGAGAGVSYAHPVGGALAAVDGGGGRAIDAAAAAGSASSAAGGASPDGAGSSSSSSSGGGSAGGLLAAAAAAEQAASDGEEASGADTEDLEALMVGMMGLGTRECAAGGGSTPSSQSPPPADAADAASGDRGTLQAAASGSSSGSSSSSGHALPFERGECSENDSAPRSDQRVSPPLGHAEYARAERRKTHFD
jgi:hypothetical protein